MDKVMRAPSSCLGEGPATMPAVPSCLGHTPWLGSLPGPFTPARLTYPGEP